VCEHAAWLSGIQGFLGGSSAWWPGARATLIAHLAILGRDAGMCSIVESRRLTTLSSARRLRSSSVAFVSCRFLHPDREPMSELDGMQPHIAAHCCGPGGCGPCLARWRHNATSHAGSDHGIA
jgi:hypothetical protein